ncbi:PTS sugar transporter subunit IIBCA [Streptococcus pneumoniae]|uniref:PTS sugar transporter subunit IIBCA n=1 Tax=Streptococcus pneumoniae TaxID=1313 RepID=UPI001C602365|nr:PTS sugar transporter subunit IIBCA [Streptococcus pneumoniae]MBW4999129.1 PTS glucose transporter subunit IIA [Streptococcus pneumoniae]
MGKFEQEAKDLLQAIGGKENVTAVTHCATRMRFVLRDDKKANVKAIESIPAVKGTFTNAGQFQVIIGNDVPIFYNDFTAVSGIEGVSKEATKSAAKSNQNVVQGVMTTLAEIFTPIIPALILAHTVLGPIGWTIGQGLSSVVLAGLTGPVKWLFGAIFGALYAPFVITGLHHMTNAIDTQLIADAGGTALWPMIALSNIAQGSAVFAYYFMHRHDECEAQVSLPATISAYLGVTEPALFGVNVKYIYPFVAGMTGSALAGMLSVTFNVTAASIGIGGLPGILSIQPQYMLPFAGTMLVAIVVPMLLTFFFRKAGLFTKIEGDTNLQAEFVAQEEAEFVSHEPVELTSVEIISPLTGQVKELSQATDPVFASGVMGQGLVIEPSQGELTSPVNGTVTVLFPTKHAIGIVSDEGVELLIHIGMDTVGLDGKGFESLVVQGDHVIVGQQLIRFDMDVIKAAGLVTETPVIITNQDAYTATITGTYPTTIQAGASLMVATRI